MQIRNPFHFGGVVRGLEFINRKKEINLLSTNFRNSLNTILISPRRWGKTSLVKTTIERIKKENPDILFCYLDLFKIKTQEQFLEAFLKVCLKAPSNKLEDALRWSKEVLQKITPQISFSLLPDKDEFNLKLAWDKNYDPQIILDLPEKITQKTKKRLVICIDEFQNIDSFDDSLSFQKILRSFWQNHRNVAYCLFGSKRHTLAALFTQSPQPFYRFGDIFFLQKISREHWVAHLVSSFKRTNKTINKKHADYIIDLMNNNPYHVQQLSYYSWHLTSEKCSGKIIDIAFNEMMDHNSLLFEGIVERLSENQMGLLQALANGEKKLHSKEVLQKYRIGTSANATKIKKTLQKREIIDSFDGNLDFEDPLFKAWFKKFTV